ERRLAVVTEVAHGLVQADHPLLLDVVEVGPHQEVAAGLGPHETPVALEQGVEGGGIARLVAGYKDVIAELSAGEGVQAERHSNSCVWCVGDCNGFGGSPRTSPL